MNGHSVRAFTWLRGMSPAGFLIGFTLLLYPLVFKGSNLQNLGILALIGAVAATGWNLLGGFLGQISFGHSVFFGVGAYSVALSLIHWDLSPWLGICLGGALAALVGVIIGFPVFRLRTHYFTIATLAVQQVVFIFVVNQSWLGSATGLALPQKDESFVNLQFSFLDQTAYYLSALGLYVIATAVVIIYLRSRAGYYTRAIRDDEDAARAVGVPSRRYKLVGIALSAAITAAAGGLYAMYVLFVDPTITLGIQQSIAIAIMAVLGGAGTLWGPLIGAWAWTAIQVWTRNTFGGSGGGVDWILFGVILTIIAIFEPEGIVAIPKKLKRRWRRRTTADAQGKEDPDAQLDQTSPLAEFSDDSAGPH